MPPTREGARKVLAVLDDLLFTVKINEAAKRAGVAVHFVKSEPDALLQAAEAPALIIIDLNCTVLDPLRLIRELKSRDDLKQISLLGYVSHVEGERKRAAQQAGCDQVLPRSAFSQNLIRILQRHK